MAACHPQDGHPGEPDKITPSSLSHALKPPAVGAQNSAVASSATSEDIKLKGDQVYDEVANFNEEALRNLLEEVTNAGKRKDKSTLSPSALALLKREQDALREESSSGDDARDLIERCRSKKFLGRHRRHHHNHSRHSQQEASAAARSSTGGSLGSLHDLSDTKQVKQTPGTQNQGVASRCREGGSCGNLSRGSFETLPPNSRKKGGGGRRGAREAANAANRASASQREGGSLQNLSKSEGGPGESKKLHKSGSLSQVCSEPSTGARSKNRRQKTSSESSGRHETAASATASTPTAAAASDSRATFPPEGVGGRPLGGIASPDSGNNDDSMSDVVSEGETTEEEVEPLRGGVGERSGGVGAGNDSSALEECGIELQTVTCHRADHDTGATTPRQHLDTGATTPRQHHDTGATTTTHTLAEVDKGINFSLSRSQVDGMTASSGNHRTFLLQNSHCLNSVFKEDKATGKEEESGIKRKLMGNRSDTAGGETKSSSSLDENGNPVVSPSPGGLVGGGGGQGQGEQQHQRSSGTVVMTSRKQTVPSSLKDVSRFDRVKARNDKKKANREKDIVVAECTPGFRGDQDLNDILKFIGAEVDDPAASARNKRKHNKSKKEDEKARKEDEKARKEDEKTKKDDDKPRKDEENKPRKEEEREGEASTVRKGKNKSVDKDGEEQAKEEITATISTTASEPARDNNNKRSRDEDRKAGSNNNNNNNNNATGKKVKNNDQEDKKGDKKGSGRELRESSSMEELVSLSRKSDGRQEIRKQMTVDDGEMSTLGRPDKHRRQPDKLSRDLLSDMSLIERQRMSRAQFEAEQLQQQTSEFVADFYSVGDSFLSVDHPLNPSSPSVGGGDFEVVNNKKRGKRSRTSYSQGSGGRMCDQDRYGSYGDDGYRFSRFNHFRGQRHSERPHINFSECPRTAHEGSFLAQWSQMGVGERYGGERYGAQATTSAPHSEDSNSDGDDSVHSMPVPSITPRPDVRKPPPSSDSTPQASYANIAKLAASANRAQMKRMSPAVSTPREQEGESSQALDTSSDSHHTPQDPSKLPPLTETHPTNILDDNFPSLAESIGVPSSVKSAEPSLVKSAEVTLVKPGDPRAVKVVEPRTSSSDSGVSETGSVGMCSDAPHDSDGQVEGGGTERLNKPNNPHHNSQQLPHNHYYYKHHHHSPHATHLPPPEFTHHHPPPPHLPRSLPQNYAVIPPPTATFATLPPPPTSFTTQPPPPHATFTTQPPPHATFTTQPPPPPRATFTTQPPPSANFLTTQAPPSAAFTTPPPQPSSPQPPHKRHDVTVQPSKSVPQTDTTNGLPANDRQGSGSNVRCRRNGPAAAVASRKLEPAVIFTDNARFHHIVEGIEFGFGPDQPIATTDTPETTTPDTDTSQHLEADSNCYSNNNNNINITNNNHNKNSLQTINICKRFQAPKNDKISYNYEELIRHFSKNWESVMQQMEKDPKSIQYWQPASRDCSGGGGEA